jgi:hypothetical protein
MLLIEKDKSSPDRYCLFKSQFTTSPHALLFNSFFKLGLGKTTFTAAQGRL